MPNYVYSIPLVQLGWRWVEMICVSVWQVIRIRLGLDGAAVARWCIKGAAVAQAGYVFALCRDALGFSCE